MRIFGNGTCEIVQHEINDTVIKTDLNKTDSGNYVLIGDGRYRLALRELGKVLTINPIKTKKSIRVLCLATLRKVSSNAAAEINYE